MIERRVLFICAVFLALQVAIPLSYYLRDDRYDERFAWRMFSSVRLERCRTDVHERLDMDARFPERRVALNETLHRAWINTIERNRRPVIEAFLKHRCERPEVAAVTLTNTCVAAPGASPTHQKYARNCRE